MKMILKVFLVIGVILVVVIILFLVTALFVKKEYAVQREVIINKSNQVVYDYVKFLKNQDNFSKWVMADPAMKKEFRGVDGEVNFVYGWNGNNQVGEGEQEIKGLTEGKRVDCELRFKRPMEGVASASMIIEPIDAGSSKLQWRMEGISKYPMNVMNLFTDKILGKDLELSLSKLKSILEK